MSACVVIPTYNEEKRIGQVLAELVANNFDVIVVDDCSRDKTLEVVKQFPVYFVEHLVNQGQGGALRTGTHLAQKLNFDIVAHFDADGQHRLEDLQKIIALFETSDYDVIMGSRFLEEKSDLPANKEKILALAKIFSRTMLQLNFSDPQNGLRAFRLNVLDKINWQRNDFQHCTEILSLIVKNNLHYCELPIKVNYDEYSTQKAVRPRMSMGWKLLANKILDRL
jgi:glycosyltransferase involved in cell wall biosynthesis